MIKSVSRKPIKPDISWERGRKTITSGNGTRSADVSREAKPKVRLEELSRLSTLQAQAISELCTLKKLADAAEEAWYSLNLRQSARIRRARRRLDEAQKCLLRIRAIESQDDLKRPLWYLREDITDQCFRLHELEQEIESLAQERKRKYDARTRRRAAKQ